MNRLWYLVLVLIFTGLLSACGKNDDVDPDPDPDIVLSEFVIVISKDFSFTELNNLEFELDLPLREISIIEGENITAIDYTIDENILIIFPSFLTTLLPGEYILKLYTLDEVHPFKITILDENNPYRIVNSGFENGNLFGWQAATIFKGEQALLTFIDEAVVANDLIPSSDMVYAGEGDYVFGFFGSQSDWEERLGRLRSSNFELSGTGWITYMLGGGKNADLSFISIRESETNLELARFGNQVFVENETYQNSQLVLYRADLSEHIGKSLYLEIQDLGGRSYDFLTMDAFETYHETVPTQGYLANDIKPVFETLFVPNQVPNGNFAQNLDSWYPSTLLGWADSEGRVEAWHVDGGVLKSNLHGDGSRGLIRSSLFRLDGSGIISFKLGAAQGERFDKDTFVSVREAGTNIEIMRVAHTRHQGTTMVTYYLDLSDHLGKALYLEVVDNAVSAWDTIFISEVVTYYAERPPFTFSESGVDLNE